MNNWLHSAHVSKQQPRQEPKYSNTSTDVEKTAGCIRRSRRFEKHLHGRGEDGIRIRRTALRAETPPRTWRRQLCDSPEPVRDGNTSTDVEKTLAYVVRLIVPPETPPRTWRRLIAKVQDCGLAGNTSTDVEKTRWSFVCMAWARKHLHGRGEDSFVIPPNPLGMETPPRTWRRREHSDRAFPSGRNTSTDVEKTASEQAPFPVPEKHLHGRGEDFAK